MFYSSLPFFITIMEAWRYFINSKMCPENNNTLKSDSALTILAAEMRPLKSLHVTVPSDTMQHNSPSCHKMSRIKWHSQSESSAGPPPRQWFNRDIQSRDEGGRDGGGRERDIKMEMDEQNRDVGERVRKTVTKRERGGNKRLRKNWDRQMATEEREIRSVKWCMSSLDGYWSSLKAIREISFWLLLSSVTLTGENEVRSRCFHHRWWKVSTLSP